MSRIGSIAGAGLAMAIAAARSAGMSVNLVPSPPDPHDTSKPSARERPKAIYVAPSLTKHVRNRKEGRGAAERRRKQMAKIAAKREGKA